MSKAAIYREIEAKERRLAAQNDGKVPHENATSVGGFTNLISFHNGEAASHETSPVVARRELVTVAALAIQAIKQIDGAA